MAAIDLTMGLDISDAAQKLRELREAAKMAVSGVAGDINATEALFDALNKRIQDNRNTIKEVTPEIAQQEKLINTLQEQINNTQAKLKNASSGTINKGWESSTVKKLRNELVQLEEQLQQVKTSYNDTIYVLDRQNKKLEENQKTLKMAQTELKARQQTLKQTETSYTSIRTQMAAVRNEMTALDLAGQKNSTRYKELQSELGRLGTAYRKVQFEQKALSTGATQWAGIQSTLQGVMGGFAAYQGVLGLVATNSEELVKIQTRLQSVMGIIMGMTQVSNTLHATSAARMTTLTKVTELWTAANKWVATTLIRVGVVANTARIAAIAFNGVLTMGIGAAIGIAISAITKLVEKHKEAKKAAEESAKKQREAFENYAQSVGSKVGDTTAKFRKLQEQYKALGDSLSSKKKFIKENAEEFKKLGIKVTDVTDAENLLVNNSEAFISALQQRAQAAAAMELAGEKYKQAIEKMMEAESINITATDNYGRPTISNLTPEQQKGMNDAIFQARSAVLKEWGAQPQTKQEGEILAQKLASVTADAADKYIEGIRQGLQNEADKFTSEGDKAVRFNINKNKEADKTLKNAGIVTADEQAAADKRAKAEADAQKKLAELLIQNQFEVEQAQIDMMKEGTEKKLAQIDLDYKKREQAITEGEKKLREVQGGTLTEEQQGQIQIKRDANSARRQSDRYLAISGGKLAIPDLKKEIEEERDAWNEYLIEYGTFREKYQAIKDKYDILISEAKTQGEKLSFEAERDAELATLEVAMSEWAQGLVDKTLEELEKLTIEAKQQLEDAQDAFNSLNTSDTPQAQAYIQTINELRAKIALLENKTKTAKQAVSDNDWGKGAQLINEISSTAREAASALGEFDEGLGKAATFIATLGSAAGNLISTIDGVKAASSAAGTAMSSMEKASVVLMAISVAFQVMQAAFSLFSREDPVEKTRRAFLELNNEITRLKQEAAIDRWDGTIFGDASFNNAINNINVATDALARYNQGLENIRNRGKEVVGDSRFVSDDQKTGLANLYREQKSWESAAESIANMQVQTRHSTWIRSAKYDSLGNLLPGLFDDDGSLNMDALKELQGSDLYSKISEQNRQLIDDLIDDWELYEEAMESVRDYLSDIFGDLGDTMTDALIDAFANGTDAAQAFADSVSDMLRKLAKDMILSTYLTPIFEKGQKQMEDVMAEDLTDEARFAKLADIMGGLTSEALAAQDDIFATLKAFQEAAKKNGLDLFSDSAEAQKATARGFQAMSQETGDELNGRFTDIQGKVTNIRDYVLLITDNGTQQLNEMINIRDIMIQLNGNVADIRGYTQVLPAMNDTLASMNRKLDDL